MTRLLAALALLSLAGCQTVNLPACTHHCTVLSSQERGGQTTSGQATVPMSALP